MVWTQPVYRYGQFSDLPLSEAEIMQMTDGGSADDPKCNIVFP